MFDINEIKAKYSYDPDTGVIYRRLRDGSMTRASYLCGKQGRNRVSFKSRKMFAYRVAWLLHYGDWPKGEIDHINGNQADDRLCNLRDVSRATNQENLRGPTSLNRLGVLGVTQQGNRYYARLKTRAKYLHLGTYATPEEAHAAYLKAKRIIHAGCTI